mmetsp:Transcript_84326/g.272604  ORF Transcript_84326/g.272604 Transcript_84326/m.272604 type:complete len:112 (-) Transcript_84326:87-422(-)
MGNFSDHGDRHGYKPPPRIKDTIDVFDDGLSDVDCSPTTSTSTPTSALSMQPFSDLEMSDFEEMNTKVRRMKKSSCTKSRSSRWQDSFSRHEGGCSSTSSCSKESASSSIS